MAQQTWRLIGLEALQEAFRRQPALVRARLGQIVSATSFSLAQRAKSSVPVDTGALQSAIRAIGGSGLRGGVAIDSGTIRGRQPEVYWRFVEYGTVRVSSRPFLRSAAEAEFPAVEARLRSLASDMERDLSVSRAA